MDYTNVKIEKTKDQVVGRAKESFGDATNNEELELRGKIQSSTADAKKKVVDIMEDSGEKLTDMKEDAGETLTDMKETAGENLTDMKDKIGEKLSDMKEKAGVKLTDMKEKTGEKLSDIIDGNEVEIHFAFKPITLIAGVVIGVIALTSLRQFSHR